MHSTESNYSARWAAKYADAPSDDDGDDVISSAKTTVIIIAKTTVISSAKTTVIIIAKTPYGVRAVLMGPFREIRTKKTAPRGSVKDEKDRATWIC